MKRAYEYSELLAIFVAVIGAVELRLLAIALPWWGGTEFVPYGMGELTHLLTAWFIPAYSGAWLAERPQAHPLRRLLPASFLFLCILGVLELLKWNIGPEFAISGPIAFLTGGIMSLVYRSWFSTESPESVTTASNGLSYAPKVLVMGGGLCILTVANFLVASSHTQLPEQDAQRLAPFHGLVFTTRSCPYCQELRPFIADYQRRYPNIRLKVVEQENSREILLRYRINALFKVPPAPSGSVPVLFTSTGYTVGPEDIRNRLEQLARQPGLAPTALKRTPSHAH